MTYHFETTMQVRDYECDVQGIVNNANYLHYIEHTRHLFLLQQGVSFVEMHEKGEDFVVARMTLQYKTSLRPDDIFRSCIRIKKDGVKYVFYQDILRASDNKLCFRAQVDTVCIVNGRMQESKVCDEAFKEYLTNA